MQAETHQLVVNLRQFRDVGQSSSYTEILVLIISQCQNFVAVSVDLSHTAL